MALDINKIDQSEQVIYNLKHFQCYDFGNIFYNSVKEQTSDHYRCKGLLIVNSEGGTKHIGLPPPLPVNLSIRLSVR